MKIAVNTRFLLNGKLEGFGRFTDEIMKRMVRSHPEHEFYFLFDRPYDTSFIYAKNVTPVVIKPQARHPILFYIWFEVSVARYLKKLQPDLFVSPDGYLSLKWPGKQLGVIHDLNFEHYPKDLPKSARKYLRKYFPQFAQKADRIVTVSEFSKWDIHTKYDIPNEKIDIVYNSAGEGFAPLSKGEQEKVRQHYSEGQAYFVYLGSLHPRKNIHRLLQAFDRFKEQGFPHKLLIVGDQYWINQEMQNTITDMVYRSEVVFTGHLEFNEMVRVLGSAEALTYVSYFEGFGIPLIEAMKCDVPVISGDRTSLPEIVGDAGLLVDPFSVEDIAKAMVKLVKDPDLRVDLVNRGRGRVKDFSWDQSARDMWQSIETCLGQ